MSARRHLVHERALGADIAEIPRLIDWVERVLASAGIAESPVFKMTLALEEAAINVIDHAFAGVPPPHAIRLRLTIAEDRLTAELIDNGRAFDPSDMSQSDLSLSLDQRKIGGPGLQLIRTVVDRVEYRRADGENHLLLEKALP